MSQTTMSQSTFDAWREHAERLAMLDINGPIEVVLPKTEFLRVWSDLSIHMALVGEATIDREGNYTVRSVTARFYGIDITFKQPI